MEPARSRGARLRAFLAAWSLPLAPALVAALALVMLGGNAQMERVRNLAFDQFQRWEPRHWSYGAPVRVVDIDAQTLERLGAWPWPRRLIGDLAESLAAARPAAIAFDMLFSEPDPFAPATLLSELPELPEREILAAALAARRELNVDALARAFERGPFVASMALTASPTDSAALKSDYSVEGPDAVAAVPRFAGAILPTPELRAAAKGLGAVNQAPEPGYVARRGPLVMAVGPAGANPVLVPSLAAEALRLAFSSGEKPTVRTLAQPSLKDWLTGRPGATAVVNVRIGDASVPTEPDGSVRIRFAGPQAERTIPAWKILSGDVHRDELLGRIILVGSSAPELADLRATPLSAETPNVEVQAELLEHLLGASRLSRPAWAAQAEALAILLLGALVAFCASRLRALEAALVLLVALALAGQTSWLLFQRLELLFDPAIPGLALTGVWGLGALLARRRANRDRRFIREAFRGALAPALVEDVAAAPALVGLDGKRIETSVLCCVLHGLDRRLARLAPEEAVALVRALQSPLAATALAHGGTIARQDDFGLVVFWNAPLPEPRHAERACETAFALTRAFARAEAFVALDSARRGESHAHIRIGVGLASGRALVGDMGGPQRFDYAIRGEPVAAAARLAALTEICDLPALAGAGVAAQATDQVFVGLGPWGPEGEPIFALHANKGVQDKELKAFFEVHDQALAAIARQSPQAQALMRRAVAHPAGAAYADFYRWRLRLAALPPA
jgi:adenylate cyclase